MSYGQEKIGVAFTDRGFYQTLEEARTENKPIFIEFGVGCGHCRKMKKEVFTAESVASFYNANFINLLIDEQSDIGLDLAERFNVYSYPTYLFLNSRGEIVHLSANFKPAGKMVKEGEKALSKKIYKPSGVWWNHLKTRSKSTYTLFNTANASFMSLTEGLSRYSSDAIRLRDFRIPDSGSLQQAKIDIEKSLKIESYYFNAFTAALVYYQSGEELKARHYAEMALSDFPHHWKSLRTRDDLLNEILANTRVMDEGDHGN